MASGDARTVSKTHLTKGASLTKNSDDRKRTPHDVLAEIFPFEPEHVIFANIIVYM